MNLSLMAMYLVLGFRAVAIGILFYGAVKGFLDTRVAADPVVTLLPARRAA